MSKRGVGIPKEKRALQPPPNLREKSRHNNYGVCVTCGKRKRLTRFHKNGTGQKYKAADPRRYKPSCAECVRARTADPNAPGFDPTAKPIGRPRVHKDQAQQKRRLRRRTRIACLKYVAEKGCAVCGERDPRVLEFDHIDPATKTTTIAQLISRGYSWASEQLRQEIRKCRILCANCHRVHTAEQQDYYSHPHVKNALREIHAEHGIDE